MNATRPVRVWDVPTRLFHWLMVGLFLFSWWSVKYHHMDWHRLSGTALLGLLVFRLIWGCIGGSTARFRNFLRGPGTMFRYLRGQNTVSRPGHNPLGGYSVIALLALMLVQTVTGLFATDTDGLESGPLSYLVSFDQSQAIAKVHGASFNLLLALIGLHVAAILFYLLRRHNLVTPMITGADSGYADHAGELVPAGRSRFLVAAAISSGLVWWLVAAGRT